MTPGECLFHAAAWASEQLHPDQMPGWTKKPHLEILSHAAEEDSRPGRGHRIMIVSSGVYERHVYASWTHGLP